MGNIEPYDRSVMTGCLTGEVPTITDFNSMAENNVPVKLLVNNISTYGFIIKHHFDNESIDFRTSDNKVFKKILLSKILVFSAKLGASKLFTKNSAIIVNQQLFTVIKSDDHLGLTIWVGNKNLIYYGEDIDTLIKYHGSYVSLDGK